MNIEEVYCWHDLYLWQH